MAIEVGSIVEGVVTGITNFGAFVELPEKKVGLVHISEVADEYVMISWKRTRRSRSRFSASMRRARSDSPSKRSRTRKRSIMTMPETPETIRASMLPPVRRAAAARGTSAVPGAAASAAIPA